MAFPLLAAAAGPQVNRLDTGLLHLNGGQCTFENQTRQTVMASDWAGKFWIKVDGRIVEFVTHRSDEEMQRQSDHKRWRDTLQARGLTVTVDLKGSGVRNDTAAYQGRIEVRRGDAVTRIAVSGGCSA